MFIVKHFKDLSVDEFFEIAKARYEVFACEQKITQENDFDDIDKKCYHIFSLDNNIITSYARIIPKEYSSYEDTSIGRVLVNKNYILIRIYSSFCFQYIFKFIFTFFA